MVRPADMTLNIKNQQTRFAGLPSQEKQFFYHEFLFRPVQARVRNPHMSFPPCFLQRSTSRQELLSISICMEDMTLLLQPVPFPIHEVPHSLELSDSL